MLVYDQYYIYLILTNFYDWCLANSCKSVINLLHQCHVTYIMFLQYHELFSLMSHAYYLMTPQYVLVDPCYPDARILLMVMLPQQIILSLTTNMSARFSNTEQSIATISGKMLCYNLYEEALMVIFCIVALCLS